MTNEITLIIECCKISQDFKLIEEKISQIKNWDDFITLAYSHGVFPLVYQVLKRYENDIPLEVFAFMKQSYMNIVKTNMLMTSELIKVSNLLEENGIKIIAFKGPVLSVMAYGDVISRQYVDLDILIAKKDNKKIFELLKQLNYESILSIDILDKKICNEIITDFNLKNKINGIELEFHWKLIEKVFKMDLNYDYIKDHIVGIPINNYTIKTFSIENQIVYLSMHGSKHGWERIEWLSDLNRLISVNRDKINFEKIIEISISSHSKKCVLTMFYLLKMLFNFDLINIKNIHVLIYDEINLLFEMSLDMIVNYSQNHESLVRKKKLESYRFNMIDNKKSRILYSLESFLTLSKLDCNKKDKFKIILLIKRFFRLLKGIT